MGQITQNLGGLESEERDLKAVARERGGSANGGAGAGTPHSSGHTYRAEQLSFASNKMEELKSLFFQTWP